MKQVQCLFVILALSVAISEASEAKLVTEEKFSFMPFRRFHVHIVNGLKNGVLNSHCLSGENDLGVRRTAVNGEYEWGFKVNYPGTTLFHCRFWWRGGSAKADVFKADDKFVYDKCGGKTCTWKAADDGLYMYVSKHKTFELQSKWQRP